MLRPGGRVALSLWCDLQDNPYFRVLVQAVSKHIGADTAAGLRAAFSLVDSEAIRRLLMAAGFVSVTATVKELHLELPRPRDFVPQHVSATPMSAAYDSASEEARWAVARDVSEQLAAYETGQGIRVPFRTHLVMGTR